MQHEVIIALGSNCNRQANIRRAAAMLGRVLSNYRCSPILQTEPLGIVSPPFLNAVIAGSTDFSLSTLERYTKKIEAACGRNAADNAAGRIAADVDILVYGGRLLRPADWQREYIQKLVKTL